MGLAVCLHAALPALVALLGLLFAARSISEPVFVTVSLVRLEGTGTGFDGSAGGSGSPGAAGLEGKKALPKPPGTTVAVQRNRMEPRKITAPTEKQAVQLSRRRPVSRRPREKAVREEEPSAEHSSKPVRQPDTFSSKAVDGPASSSGVGKGLSGNGAGGGSFPGAGSEGGGGVSGSGTGSGGLDLKQVDTPPVPIKRVEPEFPEAARQMGLTGKVVLRFRVEADGSVAKASVIAAQPEGVFNRSALEAIDEWKFKPGRYKGKPVAVWVELPVVFRLSR